MLCQVYLVTSSYQEFWFVRVISLSALKKSRTSEVCQCHAAHIQQTASDKALDSPLLFGKGSWTIY